MRTPTGVATRPWRTPHSRAAGPRPLCAREYVKYLARRGIATRNKIIIQNSRPRRQIGEIKGPCEKWGARRWTRDTEIRRQTLDEYQVAVHRVSCLTSYTPEPLAPLQRPAPLASHHDGEVAPRIEPASRLATARGIRRNSRSATRNSPHSRCDTSR